MPLLSEWLVGWNLAPSAGLSSLYPPSGFVVDRCAVGFVFACPGTTVGYIDGFVTDPKVSARRCHSAIKWLVEELLGEAKSLGITSLRACTNVRGLNAIARARGFVTTHRNSTYLVNVINPAFFVGLLEPVQA